MSIITIDPEHINPIYVPFTIEQKSYKGVLDTGATVNLNCLKKLQED